MIPAGVVCFVAYLQPTAPSLGKELLKSLKTDLHNAPHPRSRQPALEYMDKPGAFAFKCKCCNNPWQLAETSSSAANGEIDFGFCAPCKDKGENLGLDPKNIDEKYRAQDNFYLYSNGGWKDANPCPPAYPRWGVFNVLNESNQERLKAILEDLEKEASSAGGEGQDDDDQFERRLLCNYHQAFRDVDTIEKDGIAPLVAIIESIQKMSASTMTLYRYAVFMIVLYFENQYIARESAKTQRKNVHLFLFAL